MDRTDRSETRQPCEARCITVGPDESGALYVPPGAVWEPWADVRGEAESWGWITGYPAVWYEVQDSEGRTFKGPVARLLIAGGGGWGGEEQVLVLTGGVDEVAP